MGKSTHGGTPKRGQSRPKDCKLSPETVQCPHLHFKSDIIDRSGLTKEQHLNLLCTPKGYRWAVEGMESGDEGEEATSSPPKRMFCSGRRLRRPEKTYVHNFLAEVWTLLTPEMIDRLKGILMNEFSMSPEEANKFLAEQNELSSQKQDKRKPESIEDKVSPSFANLMLKRFNHVLLIETEGILNKLLCGPRSKEQVELAETVLAQLCDLTNEDCTLQTPKTGVQRILVFLADQIATWLLETVAEADDAMIEKRRRELYGEKDTGGKGDDGDDSDDDGKLIKPKAEPKKKKPVVKSVEETGHGDAPKPKPRPSTTGSVKKEKEKEKDPNLDKPKPARTSTAPEPKKSAQEDKVETKKRGSSKAEVVKKPSRQGSKGTTDANKRGASGASKGERKSRVPSPSKPAPSSKSSRQSEVKQRPTVTRPSTSKSHARPSSDSARRREAERKALADSQKKPRPSSQPVAKPKTSAELRKMKMDDMLTEFISKVLSETEAPKGLPRQEALQEVVSQKLKARLGPLDGELNEAIAATSALVSVFIDKMAGTVEMEYGHRPQFTRKPGTIFSVKDTKESYAVRPVTLREAKMKVFSARGLSLAAVPETTGDGTEKNEFSKWTNEAVNLADQWCKWIDKTVSGAVSVTEKRKAGKTVDGKSWQEWKSAAEEEALKWRTTKKELDARAELMKNKEAKPKPGKK